MFIAAPFTIARHGKNPSAHQHMYWFKKTWYIYTMEYYSVVKE